MEEVRYIGLSSLASASDASYYAAVLEAIRAGVGSIPLESVNPQHAFRILQLVLCDHPELYWANFRAQTGGFPPSLYFVFPNEVARTPETDFRLNNELNKIIGELPASDSEYELAKAAYTAITSRSEYGENGVDEDDPIYLRAHSCIGCLLDHKAVCEGVAKAMQLLLQRLGISSFLVNGTATNAGGHSEAHAWLLVRIEGSYYYMDPTWGGYDEAAQAVSYAHFLMLDEDVRSAYSPDHPSMLPACNNEQGTYYAREGLVLEEWGADAFKLALTGHLDVNNRRVEIKFRSQTEYAKAKASFADDRDCVNAMRQLVDPAGSCSEFQFLYSFSDDCRVLSLITLDST